MHFLLHFLANINRRFGLKRLLGLDMSLQMLNKPLLLTEPLWTLVTLEHAVNMQLLVFQEAAELGEPLFAQFTCQGFPGRAFHLLLLLLWHTLVNL